MLSPKLDLLLALLAGLLLLWLTVVTMAGLPAETAEFEMAESGLFTG